MKVPFFAKFDGSYRADEGQGSSLGLRKVTHAVALVIGLGFAAQGFGVTCAEHCGKYPGAVHQICELTKGKVDPWVAPVGMPTADGIAMCDCPCSCVILGTLILTPTGELPIETLRRGDDVTMPLSGFEAGKVRYALSSPVEKHAVRKITTSAGEVVVSTNHLFVAANRKVISAEKLREGMKILDGSNREVAVESNVLIPKYTGSLHNLILKPGTRRMENHIYVANNLQSGDLALQDANDRMDREVRLRAGELPYILNGKIVYPKGN